MADRIVITKDITKVQNLPISGNAFGVVDGELAQGVVEPNGIVEQGNTNAVSGGEVNKITSKLVDTVTNWNDITLTKTLGYYSYNTGVFTSATTIDSTQLIKVEIGDVLKINGRCSSALMALITKFNNSENYIGFVERGVAGGINYNDYNYVSDFSGYISIAGAINITVGTVSKVQRRQTTITPKFPTLEQVEVLFAPIESEGYITINKTTEGAIEEISNDLYTNVQVTEELPLTVIDGKFYTTINGSLVDSADWKCTTINVLAGEKYLITGNSRPTTTQLIAKFNNSTYLGGEGVGNGTLQNFVDYEFIVPNGVNAIGVTAFKSQTIRIKKVEDELRKNFVTKDNISLKEYGVIIDLSNPTAVELTKIKDSIGLEIKSQKQEIAFDGDDTYEAFPLNEIRDCNILIDSFGATKITYKGEDNFDALNEVYVEIPLFYMKRYREGNLKYNLISNYQGDGYFPAPMFVENGKVLDKVYIGKYENSLTTDGKVVSSSGKRVLFEKNLSQNRDLIYAKGRGFAPWDYRLTQSLQHLFLVFFANKNSQNLIGGGWTGLHQPFGNASTIQNPTGTYTEIIVNYSASYHTQNYFIGQDVGIIDDIDPLHPMVERRVLVDLKLNYPEAGKTTLVLDEAVTIDPAVNLIGGAPQKTGWTDVLEHHTGRTTLKTSRAGTCAVKLFGIENVWGNVWTQIDGTYITNQRIKISYDITNFNNLGTNYKPMSYILPIQDTLGIPGDQFGSILNLGIDNANPWVRFAESFGGDANQNNSYGDWYYQYNLPGPYMGGFGGGFDHYERAGLFCDRHWYLYNQTWYLVGSRTQFKMI